ncbi:MAG TPA: GTP-binding protein [Flavipsychrobacter sp.]|nr:GTP-binding protein [Flavipsychrobacter sp.]
MDILRFITAGSIDDGKSTLIGRLLYDTENIKTDILDSISLNDKETKRLNLAFLTDGLRSERLHGITIDIAYKYFTTPQRKYIIIDAPGHFQFTRNLVTGASVAEAIIILIDAVNGVMAQTRRHLLVASFLRMEHVVVAINKMDLVNYDENVFNTLKDELLQITKDLGIPDIVFIPISALNGDNVTSLSSKMNWYKGATLLEYLENCNNSIDNISSHLRLPVQHKGTNGYYGNLVSGTLKKGDTVVINPRGREATVEKIIHGYEETNEAISGQNIYLLLGSDANVERGDVLSHKDNLPADNTEFEAEICWLDSNHPLQINKEYIIRINTATSLCSITEVIYKIDIDTFEKHLDQRSIAANEFARVKIKTENNLAYDAYSALHNTGRGIIIDIDTNNTLAAFVIK